MKTLVALTAVLIALGTTSRADTGTVLYAQLLPQQQLQQQPLSQQLQQQQFQLQQSVACKTQCASVLNSCTQNCPATSAAAPVPDPHAACIHNCSQSHANCQQSCTGR